MLPLLPVLRGYTNTAPEGQIFASVSLERRLVQVYGQLTNLLIAAASKNSARAKALGRAFPFTVVAVYVVGHWTFALSLTLFRAFALNFMGSELTLGVEIPATGLTLILIRSWTCWTWHALP